MSEARTLRNSGLVKEATFDEEEVATWGRAFGAALLPPCVIVLSGELGSGKTRLAQAICLGYGVTEPVTSPTFALIHKYESPGSPVFHVDLYRLKGEQESAALGLEELLSLRALTIIEWPDRAEALIPRDAIRILLEHVPGDVDKRRLRLIR